MIRLYADECANGLVLRALRLRGVDILTVYEDGMEGRLDPDVLDRAAALGRVLFSQDDDLLREATRRQREGVSFSGVIFAHQTHVPIGICIEHLELLAALCDPEEFRDRVQYLPL